MPADHPLATEPGAVALSRLDGEPLVGFARKDGPRYDDALRELLHSALVTPSRESVVRERVTQLALVAAGIGVALVPSGTALLPGDITYRPLRQKTPRLTTLAMWRTDDRNPVVARTLAQIAQGQPLDGGDDQSGG